MATKTIGPSGDYTTLAAYATYLDTLNVLSAPEIGEVQNTTLNLGGSAVTFTGFTPSSTNTWTLRPATGAGFKDNGSAATNGLRYNASNGAAITGAVGYARLVQFNVPFSIIQGLQFLNTDSAGEGLAVGGDDNILENNIVQSVRYVCGLSGLRAIARNNLLVQNSGQAFNALSLVFGGSLINNTVVRPTNQTTNGTGIEANYNSATIQNNIVAGFTTAIGGGATKSGSGNAIDAASYPSSVTGQVSLAITTEFENPSNASSVMDWRLKSTSVAAKDNGTNTGTPTTDIIGQAIYNTTRDVGVWEWQPPTLATLTLSTLAGPSNTHAGEALATVAAQTVGSSLSLTDPSGYFALSAGVLSAASGAIPAGSYGIDIVETLSGAIGSPKTTSFTFVISAPTDWRLMGVATGTTSATMPTHISGDLLLAFAFRDGSTTLPTLPSGGTNAWTSLLAPTGANTASMRAAKIIATGSTHTSGTWTSATSVVFVVMRPPPGYTGDTGTTASGSGATNTLTFPALSPLLDPTTGKSQVVGFAGHRSVNQNLTTPPTGMSNIANVLDATDQAVAHLTTSGVTTFASRNVTLTGTASGWFAASIELKLISAGGTTYNVSIQAFCTPLPSARRTATLPRQAITTPVPSRQSTVSRALQASSTAVAGVARTVQKLAQAQTTPTPSQSHGLSKTLSFQALSTPVANVLRTTTRNIQALTTPTVSIGRSLSRSFQAITTPSPAVQRLLSKSVQAVTTPVGAVTRTISRLIQAISTPVPSESHGSQRNISVQAQTTPAASVQRTASRNLQAVTTPAPTISRLVSRFFQAITTPAPAAQKTVSRSIQAAMTPAPTAGRVFSISRQAVTTPIPSFLRAQAKSFQAVTTPVPSAQRTVSKTIQAVTTPVVSMARALSVAIQAVTTPAPTVRRTLSRTFQAVTTPAPAYEAIKATIISLQAFTTPVASLQRTVALNRQASTMPVPAVNRTIALALIAVATAVASCAKVISRNIQAQTTPRPSVGRLIFKRIQAIVTPLATLIKSGGGVEPPKLRIFSILYNRRRR